MKAQIVSFHCVLKNKLGQVLSTSFNQDVINQADGGSNQQSLRGLVANLQNVHPGERRQFTVPANESYGPYDPSLVLRVPRKALKTDKHLTVGSEIVTRSEDSTQVYRVTQIQPDGWVLDGNHPLAGQDLIFEIEVVSAREASKEDFEEPIYAPAGSFIH